uniref:Ig-like domain-containing protein n=1 Tax=Pygocentrus nattereri TaxID=42514 RepID=A0A3B4CJK4_PYGNA
TENFKVVGPVEPLVVEAGEDLVLPCTLQPNITMVVEWIRLYLNDRLVHLYVDYEDRNQEQMESYRGRTSLFKEELKKGNTSLKLSAVQPSDDGVYQCYVRYGNLDDDVNIYVEVKGKNHHNFPVYYTTLTHPHHFSFTAVLRRIHHQISTCPVRVHGVLTTEEQGNKVSEKQMDYKNFKVVGPAAPLVVEAGEVLVLPCSLQPNISAVDMTVAWIRTDRTDTDNLVHLYEGHKDTNVKQMKSYRGRTALFKEELQKGNTSLKLSAVQPSDEGVYQCYTGSESWYDEVILLKVVGPAEPVVVEAGEDLVLPCSIEPRISAEDMVVEWIRLYLNDRLVHLYVDYEDRNQEQMESYRGRTSLFKEELKKGNTSLKLSAVQPSDEGVYQCYVRYGNLDDDVNIYVEVKGKNHHNFTV